eukprot:GHRQ01032341.1.p2 GENE.GHRQ01032341.1~~GHRQ01032341.1.p2  ORF type:complete len:100 (+),score=16.14 GHRQ01032341.1:284-583(+)
MPNTPLAEQSGTHWWLAVSKMVAPVAARAILSLNGSPLSSADTLYSRLLAVRPAVTPGLQGTTEPPGNRQQTAHNDCLRIWYGSYLCVAQFCLASFAAA